MTFITIHDCCKVQEFWQIWAESIPPREDLVVGGVIEYSVSTSADMKKLTWRTCGPLVHYIIPFFPLYSILSQSIFIQRMVDFFWNVGAPETEIDRLNEVRHLGNNECQHVYFSGRKQCKSHKNWLVDRHVSRRWNGRWLVFPHRYQNEQVKHSYNITLLFLNSSSSLFFIHSFSFFFFSSCL